MIPQTAPSGAATSQVDSQLAAYGRQLQSSFQQAAARSETLQERQYQLADFRLCVRVAGSKLADAIWPALEHLPEDSTNGPGPTLEALAWDRAGTGVGIPEPPWAGITGLGPQHRLGMGAAARRFFATPAVGGDPLHFSDYLRCQTVFWTPDANRLPTHYRAAPFLRGLHGLLASQGPWRIVHAACVGSPDGAALLVGASGAGKSTTALLCALSGMDYLGDDNVLVRTQGIPAAACLYNSGKLHRQQLGRLPELLRISMDPFPDEDQKPVIFLHRHFPDRVALERPLRAIVVPTVGGSRTSRAHPIGPGEALRALAPSTLFTLSYGQGPSLEELATLVRGLPCFRLELGGPIDAVAGAVLKLLGSTRL